MIEATFKTFLRVIGGDKPIGDITKADCRAFKESMVSAYRKAATINKHLHFLDHLFRWAKGQGFVADSVVNPIAELRIAKSIQKKEALKRLAFTREERETLIAHPSFQRQRDRSRHPERYWIVLLCLYAGLRREEAAQLLVSQVVHDAVSDVWYFDISDQGEGQSLKNAASKRRVPLHADLTARLGFLDYVDRTKTVGHTRLFYQCAWSANGWGDATGKWFGRLVRGTLKFPPSLVLHSFRHGFITGLHSAGVPDALVYALCGHTGAGGEVHAMYTHRESFPLKVLSEAVNKLDFGLV
ncbi:MAG: tyrosine-type recombinase/integrase [Nitrospirae bacterium]|nr:tyrosine-type recombinase/integrase [Nitrospirota bacterium]